MRGDERLTTILDAAIGVFLRFGYRKTSMDDVAKAAKLSRQGLYLHFANKEELFRAAVTHALEGSLETALSALADGSQAIEARLVRAFDAWLGKYAGMASSDAADLAEASGGELISMRAACEVQFLEALGKALRSAGLTTAYKGIGARQLAATLHATARGLKHSVASRQDFLHEITTAVRILCHPLQHAP